MHGFLGCIESDRACADAMLNWMKDWIHVRPEKRAIEIQRGPFHYLASAEPQSTDDPVADDHNGFVLAFTGFIATDQLRDAGGIEPQEHADIARALLRIYRERGPEAVACLNGRYTVCVWDPEKGSLELMNDVLGLMPIFLWQNDGSFAFSSNVWAIACHPRFRKRIDVRGMVDLLLLSHQQGNRTLFEGVSVLPPGSVTTVRDGNVSSRLVRNLKFSEERWQWSIEKAADEMYALLSQSVQRRVAEGAEVLLPLSGGFDSRVLLGFLLERPAEIKTITQYQHGLYAEDTRYAKRLARRAGVRHQVVPFGDSFLAQYRRKCVAINGGLFDIHTSRYLSWFDEPNGKLLPIVSAHLGGELTSRFQVSDTAFSTPEEQFDIAFGEANNYRFAPEIVRNMLGTEVNGDLANEAVLENKQFFMSQRTPFFHRYFNWDLLLSRRRYICYQLFHFEQFTRVIAPFYDLDFVDFICSLPFAALHKQHAYRTMLREHFPALARIPNTNDLPVLTSTREVLRDFANTQYRRFIRRPVQRVLPLKRWVGHPMEQYGFALQDASRAVLDHISENRELIAQYLDPERVQQAVGRQLKGDNSASIGLLAMSSFVTALEMLEDPSAAIRCWNEERR